MPETRTARVGLHARNDFEFFEPDYQVVRDARIETLKVLSFTRNEVFERLRQEYPMLELIVRLHDSRIGAGHPSPEAFASAAVTRMNELRQYAVKFEIHNEPNHDQGFEGWGSTDEHARDFRLWYLDVLRRLRGACPWAQLGFPGLAPNWPHRDLEWLEICRDAVLASDWLGCHCYWQYDNMPKNDWGLRFKLYHEKFPGKVIEITEFGNSTRGLSQDDLATQYTQYYREMFKYPYLGSVSSFLQSSSDPQWAMFVWRKEQGEILPVVRQVGALGRPALILPKPVEPTPAVRVEWIDYSGPSRIETGQRVSASIKFLNAGAHSWLAGEVRLGSRWFNLQGQAVETAQEIRTNLPATIPPGTMVTLSQAQVVAPRVAGDYILSWDLVDSTGAWFASKGSPAHEVRVTVTPSAATDELYFKETRSTVDGPFLEFFQTHGGQELLGQPITNAFADNGVMTQYFERVVMEEFGTNQVRLKAVGVEAYAAKTRISELETRVRTLDEEVNLLRGALQRLMPNAAVSRPAMTDVVDSLPRATDKAYDARPLSNIKVLIVHHTAAPASVGPDAIARYQVNERGWPGIGYHFVIMDSGQVYQTNRLETVSYHAREANPTSVGIALAGNLMGTGPTDPQMAAAAHVIEWLLQTMGLTKDMVRGHKEFVQTACPGDQWDKGLMWRDRLLNQIALAPVPAPAG